MDRLLRPDAFDAMAAVPPLSEFQERPNPSHPNSRSSNLPENEVQLDIVSVVPGAPCQNPEGEPKDSAAVRKIQKAGREKMRRDKLNEQFIELGQVLDPDRPKNDKGTIIMDTIQLLKDLTAQVNKLKAEYATLTEESLELTQEKNDLREEKASLRSDIENLNAQYQQRMRTMFPWPAMDPSVVMASPSYPFPVPMPMPMPIPPRSIPMHPSMQPYSFFGNQNPGVITNPCSTFVPYIPSNAFVEHPLPQCIPPLVHPGSQQDSKGESRVERSLGSNEVATDLELKTPGSMIDQDLSVRHRKCKKTMSQENSVAETSFSSRCSSCRSVQDSSSNNSIPDPVKPNDEQERKTNNKNS